MALSVLFYHALFSVSLVFAYGSNKIFPKNKIASNILISISFLLIAGFSAIRYHVGTDYGSYELYFNGSYIQKMEPGYHILNVIFYGYPNGFYAVIAIATLLTYFFLFKALNNQGVLFFGLFFYILLFYALTNTFIRQGISAAIFLYSLRFILQRKFLKYLLLIILASTFHLSSLILIPVYLLNHINLSKKKLLFIIFISTALIFLGSNYFSLFIEYILLIPQYGFYLSTQYIESDNNTGLGILLKVLSGIIIIWNIDKIRLSNPKSNLFINIYMIGILLTLIASQIAIVARLAYPFNIAGIFVFAFFLKSLDIRKLTPKEFISLSLLLLFSFALFEVEFINNENHLTPYQTFLNS
jgi:transmembrane protein EpsG